MKTKLDQLQERLEKTLNEAPKLQADIKTCLKGGGDLIKAVSSDIERRKAKPKESKSLPEELVFLKTVKTFADSKAVADLEGFAPETVAEHRKQLANYLEAEWKQTKEARISAQAREFVRQALDARRLKGVLTLSAKTKEDAELALGKAKFSSAKAKATKVDQVREKCKLDFEAAKDAVGELKTNAVEVQKMAKVYEDGLKDDWIINQLNPLYRKDAVQIREQIGQIIENNKAIAIALRALIAKEF
jgi:hypothetical protein